MKKIIFVFFLLAAAGIFNAVRAADFSGKWSLDMKQSKNLPPFYANVKSHKLAVTQDEKHLSVAVDIDAGRSEPDKFNFVYNLDGSESTTETLIRTPNGLLKVPTVLNAKSGADGKLLITITRDMKISDKAFKGVTTEEWKLSPDGKVLTINRRDVLPDGRTTTAELIFVRD